MEKKITTNQQRVSGIITCNRSVYDKEIPRLLIHADREIESGEGYSLKEVLKEADRLLADETLSP